MELIEIKTATITEKGQIAIPKHIRELSGFETGSKIVIMAFENRIEIRSINQLNKKIDTALASEKSLAKDWNTQEEDEAWKNL